MDVHPPHEPVHTWRDALTHLAIVTVGLFIALMLEGLVEYAHHRHIVREARENIRQELRDNHEAIQQDLVSFQQNLTHVKANIVTLQQMKAAPKTHGSLINTMSFASLNTSAWRTARDTGALAYMPYQEVQRYSDLYSLIEMVNTQAQQTGNMEFQSLAPVYMGYDIAKLPPAETENMLRGNAQTQIALVTEQQYLRELDQDILAALKR